MVLLSREQIVPCSLDEYPGQCRLTMADFLSTLEPCTAEACRILQGRLLELNDTY